MPHCFLEKPPQPFFMDIFFLYFNLVRNIEAGTEKNTLGRREQKNPKPREIKRELCF